LKNKAGQLEKAGKCGNTAAGRKIYMNNDSYVIIDLRNELLPAAYNFKLL
jgi:hypothetical protein